LTRAWLDHHDADQPFFLFCHFNDPHEPTDTADPYLKELGFDDAVLDDPHREDLERWGSREKGSYLGTQSDAESARDLLRTKLALYDGAILQVDREIARILELLDRRGLRENTWVVVVSDHGEEFLDHAEEGRALGVDPRGVWGIGHGHTMYEELLRVPLIIAGPTMPPRVIDQQFSLVDLMPTLLGLLGLESPELSPIDGHDRTGWMADPARPPLPAYAEATAYGLDLIAYSDGRHKIVLERDGETQWGFDLDQDPLERTSLAGDASWNALGGQARFWAAQLEATAPPPTDPTQLDASMREGLKSLGYIQ
jgi:arylsulfatase A-like enzyme